MGESSKVAYSNLGLYGGDDGLNADTPFEYLEKAADKLGLILKDEGTWFRGDTGVSMLARYYGPDVWLSNGDVPNSCHDILRVTGKIHMGRRRGQPSGYDGERVIERMLSILVTDANTPLTGTLARTVILLAEHDPEGPDVPAGFKHSLTGHPTDDLYGAILSSQRAGNWTPGNFSPNDDWSWNAKQSVNGRYRNVRQDWMEDLLQDRLDTTLPDMFFDLDLFKQWVNEVGATIGEPGSFKTAIMKLPKVVERGIPPANAPTHSTNPEAPLEPMEDPPENLDDESMREETLVELKFPYLDQIRGRAAFNADFTNDIEHGGQAKLYSHENRLLSEVINNFQRKERPTVLVYAGAYPGHHLVHLIPKFKWLKYELYDPAYTKPTMAEMRKLTKGKKRAVVKVHPREFTISDLDKHEESSVLLVSDVWVKDRCKEMVELQSKWALHPAVWGYSLKFLPGADDYSDATYQHAPGRLVLQTHLKPTGGETRLICVPNMRHTYVTTNIPDYSGAVAFWQQKMRTPKWEKKWARHQPVNTES